MSAWARAWGSAWGAAWGLITGRARRAVVRLSSPLATVVTLASRIGD